MWTSFTHNFEIRRALAIGRRLGPIAALLLLGEVATRAQCAMCRLSLASPEGQLLAGSLRAGIIVLLIAPLAVFAIVALAAVRSRRRLDELRKWNPEPGNSLGTDTRGHDMCAPFSQLAFAGAAVLAALILILDLVASTVVAIGALYLVPLLIVASVGSPQSIVRAAVLLSALVGVALLRLPIATMPWAAYANGGIELSVIWAATVMLSRFQEIRLRLERRTRELADLSYALHQSAIVAATDTKGTITLANDKFCEISKYAREELLGHDHRIINSGHHSKDFMRDLWHTIANGRIWHGEIRNRAKDGTLYWVDTTIVPFLDERGKPFQYMAIRFPITERKLAEDRLREQTALARLGEMAAVVAHEVKNPIAGIRGALQVITARMPAEQGDRMILVDIVARLDALNRIVEDMLLFARPRALRQEPIALFALVGDTAAMIGCDPGLAALEIHAEGAATTIGDRELLQIVFQNILVNAAQAMGGRGRIDVTISEDGGLCEIVFADRGPGMPLDVREKAFDAFFTTKHRGTGLGLPIARKVVEAHNGDIRIDAPPSGGTSVYVRLPSAQGLNAPR